MFVKIGGCTKMFYSRVLDTVKNSDVVNTVFPIWSIIELPNSCFSNNEWSTKM